MSSPGHTDNNNNISNNNAPLVGGSSRSRSAAGSDVAVAPSSPPANDSNSNSSNNNTRADGGAAATSSTANTNASAGQQQQQPQQQQQQQPTMGQRLYKKFKPIIAGGLTGGIETLCLYPTEYVKTHLQLQGQAAEAAAKKAAAEAAAAAAASSATTNTTISAAAAAKAAAGGVKEAVPPVISSAASTTLHYNGMMDCYMKTIKHKGFFGLYQGMAPVVVGAVPKQATRWGVFEWCTSTLCSVKRHVLMYDEKDCQRNKMSLAEVSACGLIAGCVEAMVAVVPADTIKTRLIDDAKSHAPIYQNKPLYASVAMMLRQEGVRGIYKGVGGTVMKQSVNQMVRFPVQQAAMNTFCSNALCGGNDELMRRRRKSPFWNGFAGFLAGVVSVFLSQPFDVVKTRMQSQTGSRYKGSMDCFRTIVREDGWMKMYSGCVPRCMRVGGNVAMTFTLFPMIKGML